MPGESIIFRCPVEGSAPDDRSTATETRFRCEPNTTGAENRGVVIDIDTYCADELNVCPEGAAVIGADEFAEISGWIILLFVTAFGVKAMRRTISARV